MTEYLFENNAESTLESAIGGGDSVLPLQSGDGDLFPEPSAGEGFFVRVVDGSKSAWMLCTSRSGDNLTVTRTESNSFAIEATVKLALNAAILESFHQKGVFRTVEGSPDGDLTALYAGEEVYDSENDVYYKHCTGTTWKVMNGANGV